MCSSVSSDVLKLFMSRKRTLAFSVALLILSLISYVSIKKDFLLSTPRYGANGGPRMYMFHAGFR